MKIGEARQLYSAQSQKFWDQKLSLAKKKKELEEKSNSITNGKELFAQEKVTLELSYHAVSKKCEEYHNFMKQVMDIHTGVYNAEASKQQNETISENAQDMVKIMEVARRISRGGKVPASDEKKLMEYSMVMYMSAKNIAMMNDVKEKEKYDSLWDDEKVTEGKPDPNEVADNVELNLVAPEVVEVADVMASAVSGEVSV